MRTASFLVATAIMLAALPLILRFDSFLRDGRRGRAAVEAGRLALAAAAVAVLVALGGRAQ
jgi:hypothetical protein